MSSANIILHESIFEFVMETKMDRLDRKLKNGKMSQDEYDRAIVLLDQEATNYYKNRRDWSF
jgi:hypothetical protein